MDSNDLFKYLIPIIFFVVWIIGKVFGGKKKEESQPRESVKPQDQLTDSFEDSYEYPMGETIEIIQTPDKTRLDLVASSLNQQASIVKQQDSGIKGARKVVTVLDSSKTISGAQDALRTLLKDSNSVKRAFLMSEILGTPIALRQNGKMGPHWQ